MYSVTQRITKVTQPKGGYINPKKFKVIEKSDGFVLKQEDENIHATVVGLAVDYLTRALLTKNPIEAFGISIMGAERIGEEKQAIKMAEKVTELSVDAINITCQLAAYDVCKRSNPMYYKPVEKLNKNTVGNIEIMVKRSIRFFEEYGPVVMQGFTFEGGYSRVVSSGDGDFVTDDTMWDFKVSKSEPTNKHTLQLLMYYIMGVHSKHKELQKIKRLGFFNPRLNKVYLMDVSSIPNTIIKSVEEDVICYSEVSDEMKQQIVNDIMIMNKSKLMVREEASKIWNEICQEVIDPSLHSRLPAEIQKECTDIWVAPDDGDFRWEDIDENKLIDKETVILLKYLLSTKDINNNVRCLVEKNILKFEAGLIK